MNSTNKDKENHLYVLRKVEKNPQFTQRELAKELGFSLGKLNYCINELREKGLLKIISNSNKQDKRPDNKKGNWIPLTYFAVGLIGSLIGSISMLFLEINKFIPIDLLKIN